MEIGYKFCCVVDANDQYKALVIVYLEKKGDGVVETINDYALGTGEQLVDIQHPTIRPCAGESGFIKPRINRTGKVWEEAAVPEEIAAWELSHPAPGD